MGPRAKVQPGPGKHSIFSHFPKDRNCHICLRTKINKGFCRRRTGTVVAKAENVGDLISADQKVLSEESGPRDNHRYALVVQDLATQWIQSDPCKTKTSQETQKSLMEFLEPTRKPKVIHTDNSLEFGKSCEVLSWNHCTSTPHRSETHGIGERAVRRVEEGTSAVLLSGWNAAAICETFKISCLMGRHHERRFGKPFNGPVIPFGAMVECHPISSKDLSRLHQFGPEVLPGEFFGYVLYEGRIWKGDIFVANIEELEQMDASELHARRLNAKEVLTPTKKVTNSYSQSHMEQSTFLEEIGI